MYGITTATREEVFNLREKFSHGARVRLVSMNDPYRNIPVGTLGTVDFVDDTGTIHVSWDGWCRLGVVYGEDKCETVNESEENNMNNEEYLKRYEAVMKRLTTEDLLNLPSDVKEVLKNTTDLKVKVKMLEEIANALKA